MSEYYEYFEYQRHAPRRPALDEAGREAATHRVAIAGGGPVGLALALGLANHGIASVVLEADDSVSHGSRAACISRRTQEILERLGVVRPVLERALPWTAGTSYYRETPVYRLEMPMDARQKYYPMVNLEQCYFEQDLVDAIARRNDGLIDLRWQSRIAGFDNDEDGVTLRVSTPAGDYTTRADWLVACDGAKSVVRQQLGLRFTGSQYEGTYIIVDIHLQSAYPTERRAWFDPPSNPGSTILMHKQPGDIWRVDYQLRDDEDPVEAVKPEQVLPRVKAHLDWIGESASWQPVWISAYKANCLTLERYDHGRVLFAGDAAHLVPIFGVRGLNSGVDDTHNLAWKLALVARGVAGAGLLRSYSEERVFAARENMRHASKSTEFMAPPSHAFKLMREAALGLAVADPFFATLVNPRQTSSITYPTSPLALEDVDAFVAGPPPGAVLAECPIERDGLPAHLTDLLGARFTLLSLCDARPDCDARGLTVPLAQVWIAPARNALANAWDRSGQLFPLYGALPQAHYLIRPDGHVLARWHALDAGRISAAIAGALEG
ncbi:MAG: FAD-dependent monooxygenase [Burkholderiales bacterium]|nr:FAD-dependent monooxygenase [Burkholderiales bacterium]